MVQRAWLLVAMGFLLLGMVHCSTEQPLDKCQTNIDCKGSQQCVAGFCFNRGQEKGSSDASTQDALADQTDAAPSDSRVLPEPAQDQADQTQVDQTLADQTQVDQSVADQAIDQASTPDMSTDTTTVADSALEPIADTTQTDQGVADQGGCKVDTDCPAGFSCRSGTCQKGCPCPENIDPVCAADGKSYNNLCEANCQRVKVLCKGNCPCASAGCTSNSDCKAGTNCTQGKCSPCICTKQYAPVCDTDGKTHSNSCVAACQRATVKCQGTCPCPAACTSNSDCKAGNNCNRGKCSPCICTAQYAPVCDTSGKTHSNSCNASCQRATVKCQGACPCPTAACKNDAGCPIDKICTKGKCLACLCNKILAPVCGTNGTTYSNSCVARCKHATVRCAQKCPCKAIP